MKRISCFLILTLLSLACSAQNWQWAKQVGSNILQSYDYATNITDGTNSYLVGRYSGTLYLQTDTLYANGASDMYVIKYDSNGNELWAKNFGGNSINSAAIEYASGVFDVNCGCIYLTGSFYGIMTLDTLPTLVSSGGNSNIFLARMDLNGNFIWGKSFGELFSDDIAYPYIQPDGNLLIAGEIGDTTQFDSYQVLPGGFFARFNSNGNCTWAARKYSSLAYSKPAVAFINSDIVFGGVFNINPTIIDTLTIIPNSNSNDGFLARMDSTGKIIWIKTLGYSGSDGISDIGVNSNSDIIACGFFEDSVSLNGTSLYNTGKDLLFIKYDENGNLIWAKNTNAYNNNGVPVSLTFANDGTFYTCGGFSGSTTFGTYNISTSNTLDMFLARYNDSGDCLGIRHFGYAEGGSVVIDNAGSPICAGGFQNTVTIGSNTFTSNGYYDVFIAKSDAFTGLGEGGNSRMANNQLLIYANPNAGKCNITVPDDFLNEKNLTLSIYDNTGKLIQQQNLEMNDGKIKVNLEQEAKGIYNVTLSSKIKSYNGRIVFE